MPCASGHCNCGTVAQVWQRPGGLAAIVCAARFQKSPRTRPDRCLQALASLVRKPRVLHIRRCHHTTEILLAHRCAGSRLSLIRSHLRHAVCPASLVEPWSTSHSGPPTAQCSLGKYVQHPISLVELHPRPSLALLCALEVRERRRSCSQEIIYSRHTDHEPPTSLPSRGPGPVSAPTLLRLSSSEDPCRLSPSRYDQWACP